MSTEAQKRASREWYYRNKEKALKVRADYYQRNKDRFREWSKRWKDANREKVRKWGRENWRKWNNAEKIKLWNIENKEWIRERERARYHSSSEKKSQNAAKTARRRLAKCKWANQRKIYRFYKEARRKTKKTGIKHVVDHVIPLRHSLVCGLHNEFNLRVVTEHENAIKKNKFEIT